MAGEWKKNGSKMEMEGKWNKNGIKNK